MSIYSIKQLELVSGIKAHTIRIWEKRYGLFSPVRTSTNIRKYNETDVRLILNIALLLHKGYRISKVAKKSLEELSQLTIQQDPHEFNLVKSQIEPLILSTISFDDHAFKAYLDKNIKAHGLEKTFEIIIQPFLNRIGILWQAGVIQSTHEHFASNIIKHVLTYHFESLHEAKKELSTIIFFLPEGEFHEIGLLFYAFVCKSKGYKVFYFGQSTPVDDIIKTSIEIKPQAIFTSVSTKINSIDLKEFANTLHKNIPQSALLITGYIANKEFYSLPKAFKAITSVEVLNKYLKQIRIK